VGGKDGERDGGREERREGDKEKMEEDKEKTTVRASLSCIFSTLRASLGRQEEKREGDQGKWFLKLLLSFPNKSSLSRSPTKALTLGRRE